MPLHISIYLCGYVYLCLFVCAFVWALNISVSKCEGHFTLDYLQTNLMICITILGKDVLGVLLTEQTLECCHVQSKGSYKIASRKFISSAC